MHLQVEWMFKQPACLELTHNWGTENDANFKVHNGNDEPKGYVRAAEGFLLPKMRRRCQNYAKCP